jgi:hypothetical protein
VKQDEIIEIAKQAGWSKEYLAIGDERLERFANLVAQHEREACAFDAEWCIENHLEHHIPERIRSRGNK